MDEPGGGALDPLTPTVKLVSESAICTASEVAPRRRSRLLQRSGCTHQLTGNLRRHVALKLTPRTRTQTRAAAHTTANLASDRAACDGACSRSLSRSSQATKLNQEFLSYDEYVLGAVNLYLDFINMFLFILNLLSGGRE